MNFEIKTGRIVLPPKIVLYGVEGIGKSTFGASLPDPFFISTEGGSDLFDVTRVEISHASQLEEVFTYLSQNLDKWKSLVIDSIDWLEYIIGAEIAKQNKADILENIKWNKGGVFLQRRMKSILSGPLEFFKKKGKFVLLIGHTEVQTFTDPELSDSYDRYSLKAHKKTQQLYKEWSDCLFFANYDKDLINGKAITQGKRLVWANHSASLDAKNRFSIPDGLELNFNNFTPYFK